MQVMFDSTLIEQDSVEAVKIHRRATMVEELERALERAKNGDLNGLILVISNEDGLDGETVFTGGVKELINLSKALNALAAKFTDACLEQLEDATDVGGEK